MDTLTKLTTHTIFVDSHTLHPSLATMPALPAPNVLTFLSRVFLLQVTRTQRTTARRRRRRKRSPGLRDANERRTTLSQLLLLKMLQKLHATLSTWLRSSSRRWTICWRTWRLRRTRRLTVIVIVTLTVIVAVWRKRWQGWRSGWCLGWRKGSACCGTASQTGWGR